MAGRAAGGRESKNGWANRLIVFGAAEVPVVRGLRGMTRCPPKRLFDRYRSLAWVVNGYDIAPAPNVQSCPPATEPGGDRRRAGSRVPRLAPLRSPCSSLFLLRLLCQAGQGRVGASAQNESQG
jgi:hypothetical protein